MNDGLVDTTYDRLKAMAVGFEIRPGDRLNEGALSRALGVSRTPLREALNRLVAEKLFEFRPGAGFFGRTLDTQSIFDLYELRRVLETASVRLACARATDEDLQSMQDDLFRTGLSVDGLTVAEACARDEAFHIGIASATGNAELARDLGRVNDKLRYIRWIRMAGERIRTSKDEHKAIMAALLARNADAAVAAMAHHIEARKDQIGEAVREGISTIYLEPGGALAARVLEDVTS